MPPPAPLPVQLPTDPTPPQRIEEAPEIVPPPLPPRPQPIEIPPPQPKSEPQVKEDPDRARRRPPASATPAPAPAADAPPAAAAPKVPQFAPLIPDDERRAYESAIDALIARTVQNLGRAKARALSAEERDIVTRAEAFLTQARELRKLDPVAAKSLAERAELLSRQASGQ